MKVAVRIYKMSGGGQYDVPEEGDIVSWFVMQGNRVQQGTVICELETDKGVVEIIAPVSGIVRDIAYQTYQAGRGKPWQRGAIAETVDGTVFYDPPFCWIETEEVERAVPPDPVVVKKSKPRLTLIVSRLMQQHAVSIDDVLARFPNITVISEKEIQTVVSERGVMASEHSLDDHKKSVVFQPIIEAHPRIVPLHNEVDEKLKYMSGAVPAARVRAKELAINLAKIQGSGPDGLILVKDVEQYVGATSSPVEPATASPVALSHEAESNKPILLEMSRLWRTIAKNMEEANDTPTVDMISTAETFDFAPLIAFDERFHGRFPSARWFPIMAATARVLGQEEFIVFNSFFVPYDADSVAAGHTPPFVAMRKRVHMGIAYDRGEAPIIDLVNKKISGEGLRILVIHDANTKTIVELISDVRRLLKAAVRNRFDLADVSGYTSIFNNIGAVGHHSGRSLLVKTIACQINLGHVDVDKGTGVLQVVLDHRLINGSRATKFVQAIYKEMIERVLPELQTHLS